MKKLTLLLFAVLTLASCKTKPEESVQETSENEVNIQTKAVETKPKGVVAITSVEQFQEIIKERDRLMVFDLYADWCGPCKQLAPILDNVANSYDEKADYYKIDTEKLPALARAFNVQGIPHVSFFKNGGVLNTYTGLYPKEAYVQSVEIFSEELSDTADGAVKNGVRHITIDGALSAGNVLTYRGDKVELTVSASGTPFTVSLPEQKIQGTSNGKDDITLNFETKQLGFYPILIKNDSGRDDRLWLGVIQYGTGENSYREVEAKTFAEEIKKDGTFLLDVRTQNEYNDGHIKGAKLIPVQDLQRRIGELDSQKEKTILIYCRSGNRSTVAAKILREAGFNAVVNLRPGIKGWIRDDLPVEK